MRRAAEGQAKDQAQVKQAAKELEAYFVSYLMKVMREAVPKGGLLPNKMGEEFYYFYDMEIGRLAAEGGGLGFSRMVEEQYGPPTHGKTKETSLSSSGSKLPIPESSR